MKRNQYVAMIGALGIVMAACGDSGAQTSAPSAVPTSATQAISTTTAGDGDVATTTLLSTTTTLQSTSSTNIGSTPVAPTTVAATTTTTAIPTTTLIGEPTDFGPRTGDVLAVVGVESDDVLNVRFGPGVVGAIVTTLTPLRDDIVATGNNRLLSNSIWFEIEANGITGWASGRFLAYIGLSRDALLEIVDDIGAPAQASTLIELVQLISATMESTEPSSRVTTAFGPSGEEPISITVDILDIGDDSVAGYRLSIVAATDPVEGFVALGIERTVLCNRGVTEGLCV